MKTKACIAAVLAAVLLHFSVSSVYAQVAVVSGGAGAPAGSGLNGANNKGLPATGLGCGGGGGSWWGGSGGAGKFGGGGGGAGGYFYQGSMNWAGGEGGQGVLVIAWYDGGSLTAATVISTGTSITVPAGITSAKVWAIGAGGGAAGATQNDGTAGGGGGAGGVAYITKNVNSGDNIEFSIGAGGKAGHGAANGNSGGNTSVTIAGSTITGNGGSGGNYNSTTLATGGSFSGGDGGTSGGSGAGSTGDDGGGGGGGIGAVNGTHNGNDGGTGANAGDVSGLFAACAAASLSEAVPYITGFTPATGLTGTVVTITGAGFTGATLVRIGGVSVSAFTVNSDTEISATVAAGSVSGSISVTCINVTVSHPLYLFIAPPVPAISSFTPASAQTGETVTINGSNLLGISSVTFGGSSALSFTIVSDFQLTAVTGTGTTGDISVSSSGGTGTRSGFTFTSTTQSTAILFSSIQTTGMTISWTSGNAAKRVVFVKEGAGSISNPVNSTTYTASADWNSKGTQLGSSGYYCVYTGTGNSITLTNLKAVQLYTVQVFEYNGNTGAEYYFTATAAGNPAVQSTLSILPLTWLNLQAVPKAGMVNIKWATCEETGITAFEVYCSDDGRNWKLAGSLPASHAGNTSTNYSFMHNSRLSGQRFYRVCARHTDGQPAYSAVIAVSGNQPSIVYAENPVCNQQLKISLGQPALIRLFSSDGRLILHEQKGIGSFSIPLPVSLKGVVYLTTGNELIQLLVE